MNTKMKILNSATQLLKKRGYYGWSYENISQEVGIRKASIHYYYPEKSQLVLQALKVYINSFWILANDVLARNISNSKKLETIIDLYQKIYLSKDEICLCTILSADYKAISPEMFNELQSFYKQLEDWFYIVLNAGIEAREFKSDLNPRNLACVVVNCLQGLLITSKFTEDKQVFQKVMDKVLSITKT